VERRGIQLVTTTSWHLGASRAQTRLSAHIVELNREVNTLLRYILGATSLKLFSSSTQAKRLYRALGNTLGARKRVKGKMPNFYLERVNRFLRLNREYGIVKDGDTLIELGTGWMHWEAVTTKLFFDVEAVLFDIWDNRQFAGLQNYIRQLSNLLDKCDAEIRQRDRARALTRSILGVKSFDELYDLLDFEYVVDESGKLDRFENASFDAVLSASVLEHVIIETLPEYVGAFYRILKPGGYSVHTIDLQDHLYYYDRSVSPKQYLAFSDSLWKRWFENGIQYFNRVQPSEWHELFGCAHLDLVEETRTRTELPGLTVDKKYAHLEEADVSCAVLYFVHRKPE